MDRLLVVWCLAITSFANSAGAKKQIPDYVPICKRSDPDLSECYRKSFNIIIPHLANGIPEMNLRKIEPVLVEKLSLSFGTGNTVSFDALLTDAELFGLSRSHLDRAHIDLDAVKFVLELSVDKAHMTANFNGKGRFLLVQTESIGSFKLNMTKMNATAIWEGEKFVKNGHDHFRFTKTALDVSIGHMHVWFDNLFPTEELNTRINQAINENIDVIYEEIKPLVVDVVKAIVADGVTNVYNLYPLDVLYPE